VPKKKKKGTLATLLRVKCLYGYYSGFGIVSLQTENKSPNMKRKKSKCFKPVGVISWIMYSENNLEKPIQCPVSTPPVTFNLSPLGE
jgi:hypothetical protein